MMNCILYVCCIVNVVQIILMRVNSYLSEPYVELSLAFATVTAASSGGTANPPSSRDRRSGGHGWAGGRRR